MFGFSVPTDRMAVDVEESEFVWEDYLQETGALSVPPTAFKHVRLSVCLFLPPPSNM